MGQVCELQAGGVASHQPLWLAAYTRPRHEDKVQQYFRERGWEAFLPCCRCWRKWSDRRKLVEFPLFPSYVFVRLDEKDRRRAVQAPGFLWFVHNKQGPIPVDEQELHAVKMLLASGLQYDPLPSVQIGDQVEVVAGPMRGCRGTLVRKDPNSIAFNVSAINGSVRVSLPDPSWIAPLRAAKIAANYK